MLRNNFLLYNLFKKYERGRIIINYFEDKYGKREKTYRRSYYIDNVLLTKLEELSKIYRAKVPDFINDSAELLIKSENIEVYDRGKNELSLKYTVLVRESVLQGLDDLSQRYGISLSKLVNIALRNMLNEK